MDKITEALSKLLPEDQVQEVAEAVAATLEERASEFKEEFKGEYDTKMEEAYEQFSTELKEAEKTAEEGYTEAWGIIADLRNRLDKQNAEFETTMEQEYEEAYKMVLAERSKNETLETELNTVYEGKLNEMREFFIDKLDEFLQLESTKMYEQARKDILNDPSLVEHRLTLQKIVETVSDYITDEDYSSVVSAKASEAEKQAEELRGQVKILESKNIRISNENMKLSEQVRQSADLLQEQHAILEENEKNERIEKAENVQGRGKTVVDDAEIEVIKEATDDDEQVVSEDVDTSIVETMTPDELASMRVLSGLEE